MGEKIWPRTGLTLPYNLGRRVLPTMWVWCQGPFWSFSRLCFRIMQRFTLVILFSSLVCLFAVSCAPSVKDLNLSQQIIDDFPRDQALSYLRSLSPAWASTCRFDQDGMFRWLPQTGQVLPGKYPYSAFHARPTRPGVMVVITVYGPNNSQPWCMIRAESIADRDPQKIGVKRVTGKILTALMSMGVRLPSYLRAPVKARNPSTQVR